MTIPYIEWTSQDLRICGAKVSFTGSPSPLPCNGPLLYEWRIYRGEDTLTCLYIGKAKEGQYRPFKTYAAVTADLHINHQFGARFSSHPSDPPRPYFKRNPWGYRWIHHQLEAAAYRIVGGNPDNERIEIRFLATNVPMSTLNKLERLKINLAKAQHTGSTVVVNDMPSMVVRHKKGLPGLDVRWVLANAG